MISEVRESLPLPFGIYLVESKKRKINNRLRLPPSLSSHCPYLGRYASDICALLHFMSQCIPSWKGSHSLGKERDKKWKLWKHFPFLLLSSTSFVWAALTPKPDTCQVLHQHSLGRLPWGSGAHGCSLGRALVWQAVDFEPVALTFSATRIGKEELHGGPSSSSLWEKVAVTRGAVSTPSISSCPSCLRFLAGCLSTCGWKTVHWGWLFS